MGSPVRVVCRGCLRSVEVGSGEGGGLSSGDCPHCGKLLDSRSPRSGSTVGGDGSGDRQSPDDDSSLGSSTSDWMATWSRGSLGSLGRFQLRERLGDGGFGEVFLAYDPRLDRDVALKVLRLANPSERVMERFFREARAAARLDHPNIVAVHDAGFDKGRCWVAYHHVSGRPLWWCRDHQAFNPQAAARILRELADAVDHAHRLGVLHRDIKPANILIDDQGRPRLIDFGLARRSDLDSSLTHDGAVVGTPAYMSPEQALGLSRQVDERSDVFSLGVILFELLVGRRPDVQATNSNRSASSVESRDSQQSNRKAMKLLSPAAPRALRRICLRAMSEKPRDRYPSARALADDLDAWLGRQEKETRRSVVGRAIVAAGVVALALAGVASGWALATVRPWERSTPISVGRLASLPPDEGEPTIQTPAEPPLTPEAQVPPTAPVEFQFVGNLRKKRFHRVSCDDVRAMSEANINRLKSVAEAVEMGLRPCEHCRPDAPPEAADGD